MPRLYTKENPNHRENHFVLAISVSIIFFIIFLSLIISNSSTISSKILSPLADVISTYTTPLGRIAQKDLLSQPGTYAVVVKNLKTGETYSLNKNQVFESASLYKLWVMAVTMDQVSKGKISMDDNVAGRKIDLDRKLEIIPNTDSQANGSDPSKPTPTLEDSIAIGFKISDALRQMITVSDNYAALLLVSRVGVSNIDKFLVDNNFSGSNFGSPPKTTPQNIEQYYEKLYAKQFINASISGQMISLLKKQQINDRIPKYLPPNIEIAHKTGELDGNKHDAGIVFSPHGDYIIVLMSQTDNETTAAQNEANFSRDVFNYFNTKSTH